MHIHGPMEATNKHNIYTYVYMYVTYRVWIQYHSHTIFVIRCVRVWLFFSCCTGRPVTIAAEYCSTLCYMYNRHVSPVQYGVDAVVTSAIHAQCHVRGLMQQEVHCTLCMYSVHSVVGSLYNVHSCERSDHVSADYSSIYMYVFHQL